MTFMFSSHPSRCSLKRWMIFCFMLHAMAYADGMVYKTGQSTIYRTGDDGSYQSGSDHNFSRDDTNKIVTDTATGLMWKDDAVDINDGRNFTFSEAQTECENSTFGGYGDWRLPTIQELDTITDKSRLNVALFPIFQERIPMYYISSTLYATDPQVVWSLYSGNGYTIERSITLHFRVRCVRDL